MSHFTTIKTQIKVIEALRSACQEMGLALFAFVRIHAELPSNTTHASHFFRGNYAIRSERR
jgi:hypothetical protein